MKRPHGSRGPRRQPVGAPAAAAMLHPLRARILAYVAEAGSASAKEIAERLAEPKSSVGEQLRRLSEEGLLELVETKPRRGAFERYYMRTERSLEISREEAASLPAEAAREIAISLVRVFMVNAKRAFASSGAWRPAQSDSVWNSTTVQADPQGMEELAAVHQRAAAEVERTRARIHARIKETGAETAVVASSLFLFRLPAQDD